jgi:hypothetical protein
MVNVYSGASIYFWEIMNIKGIAIKVKTLSYAYKNCEKICAYVPQCTRQEYK